LSPLPRKQKDARLMAITYLKKASKTSATGEADVRATVQTILDKIEAGGDDTARAYAAKFDQWDGDIVVTPDRIAAAADAVPQTLRDDIRFAHDNVRRFAEAQKAAMQDVETEIIPGLIAGHRHVPANAAGAYVPGGRYSHIASAIMTVTTASVAGVSHIAACSPPRPGIGVPPAILYTLGLCGAHRVLSLGGVQGVAAMAFGLFGCPKADVLVGPGNQFVAEAKRILFGRVGIDMFAGPTESMVIADATADPHIVAWDLVGQAEHGYNSPVWLISLDRALAERVANLVPDIIETLPEPNQSSARDAWRLATPGPPMARSSWPIPARKRSGSRTTTPPSTCKCRPPASTGGWRTSAITARCSWARKPPWPSATNAPAPIMCCPPRARRTTPAASAWQNT
jgi:sulfopropanediol 3-dehydrogenase